MAPTAAAAIAIELGRPMLWLIVATMAGSILVLLRASLRRGRDSFYPMAGASCLITLLFLSFMNVEVLSSAAATIAAATLGLAFAQSKSRSVREQ
jgi:predicted branched-subunit amino acid permease